jgi:hypothetical protein
MSEHPLVTVHFSLVNINILYEQCLLSKDFDLLPNSNELGPLRGAVD